MFNSEKFVARIVMPTDWVLKEKEPASHKSSAGRMDWRTYTQHPATNTASSWHALYTCKWSDCRQCLLLLLKSSNQTVLCENHWPDDETGCDISCCNRWSSCVCWCVKHKPQFLNERCAASQSYFYCSPLNKQIASVPEALLFINSTSWDCNLNNWNKNLQRGS